MNKFNYQQKIWILLSVFSVLLYLVAKRLLFPTVELIENVYQIENTIDSSASSNLEELKTELRRFDGIVLRSDTTSDPRNDLLKLVSTESGKTNIGIEQFFENKPQVVNGHHLYSFNSVISGDFISLLRTIQSIETSIHGATLSSTRFYTNEERSKSPTKLYAELRFQYVGK